MQAQEIERLKSDSDEASFFKNIQRQMYSVYIVRGISKEISDSTSNIFHDITNTIFQRILMVASSIKEVLGKYRHNTEKIDIPTIQTKVNIILNAKWIDLLRKDTCAVALEDFFEDLYAFVKVKSEKYK